MKKAIILAAGRGRRLKKYHNKPKCLLKFGKQKISIIERLYDILNKKRIKEKPNLIIKNLDSLKRFI